MVRKHLIPDGPAIMRIPVDIRELIDVAEHDRRHQKQADQGKTETKIAIVQDNGQYRLPIDGLLGATAIHHNLTICFAKRRRLCEYASVSGESVGTVTIRQAQ